MLPTKSKKYIPQTAKSSQVKISYDFTPFSHGPPIDRKCLPDGRLRVVRIPEATIPSPTASKISPARLKKLKDELLRKRNSVGTTTASGYWGNGKEIWESWKRAWNLWNNHYIEGRVNPIWIKKEWPIRAAALQELFETFQRTRSMGERCEVWEIAKSLAMSNTDLDGSSGGYFAIKDLEDYKILEDDGEGIENGMDVLENSVWMPKRVGEKTLKIDLDMNYIEFLLSSKFHVKGGIDCGRSPYPVLRPAVKAIVTKDGAFIKRKIWDGVTRTIFNIPTQPLESGDVSENTDLYLTQQSLFSQVGENICEDESMFQIDIRRVERTRRPSKSRNETPLLLPGDAILEDLESSSMDKSGFKWVTDAKEPPRNHPPRVYPFEKPKYDAEYLVIDDVIWKEQYRKDQCLDTRYFLTNTNSGVLLINGVEVQQGDIAGPLPPFAVIESPGGQVSFWWGMGGRTYGEGKEQVAEYSWRNLREKKGWEHIGMIAGEVWNMKIRDRWVREMSGKSLDDDGQWGCWKADTPNSLQKETLHNNRNDISIILPPSHRYPGSELLITNSFDNEDDELRFLIQRYRMRRINQSTGKTTAGLIILPDHLIWPGSETSSTTLTITEEELVLAKKKIKEAIDQRSNARNPKTEQKQSHDRAGLLKRKSNGTNSLPPPAKRLRTGELHETVQNKTNITRRPTIEEQRQESIATRKHRGLNIYVPVNAHKTQTGDPKIQQKMSNTQTKLWGIQAKTKRGQQLAEPKIKAPQEIGYRKQKPAHIQEHGHRKANLQKFGIGCIQEKHVIAAGKMIEQQAAKVRRRHPNQAALEMETKAAEQRADEFADQIALGVACYSQSSPEATHRSSFLTKPKPTKLTSPSTTLSKACSNKRSPLLTRENWHEWRLRSGELDSDYYRWRYCLHGSSSRGQSLCRYLDWEYDIWQVVQPLINQEPMSKELHEHRQLLLPELLTGLADRAWLNHDLGVNTESTYKQAYAEVQEYSNFETLVLAKWDKYKLSNSAIRGFGGSKQAAMLRYEAGDWSAQIELSSGWGNAPATFPADESLEDPRPAAIF